MGVSVVLITTTVSAAASTTVSTLASTTSTASRALRTCTRTTTTLTVWCWFCNHWKWNNTTSQYDSHGVWQSKTKQLYAYTSIQPTSTLVTSLHVVPQIDNTAHYYSFQSSWLRITPLCFTWTHDTTLLCLAEDWISKWDTFVITCQLVAISCYAIE